MNPSGLSFCWPVAYDWQRAIPNLARLWGLGDEHIVAWDFNGRTWGGGEFTPPLRSEVVHALEAAGVAGARDAADNGRLRFAVADWWAPGVDATALQVAERNALSYLVRPGNLGLQVDGDEEWLNGEEFAAWWRCFPGGRACVRAAFVSVYKVIGDTALVFAKTYGNVVGITRPGTWVTPRGVSGQDGWVQSPLRFINWGLHGRTPGELRAKLESLSYGQCDREAEIRTWEETDLSNYGRVRGFGGSYAACGLRPISVADLRAGRWGR